MYLDTSNSFSIKSTLTSNILFTFFLIFNCCNECSKDNSCNNAFF
nr:MAG TPA: hypothetical protein [Caudoviricetes sp.]